MVVEYFLKAYIVGLMMVDIEHWYGMKFAGNCVDDCRYLLVDSFVSS